ncbi:lysophospholipid acyltransferase family protein [Catenulispora subtropica]|uniref:lysophospholipid acyltransferase family protein n=1 Tax=Catenulispora subtropica TaxID=450798 RepID=UPI0031DC72B2
MRDLRLSALLPSAHGHDRPGRIPGQHRGSEAPSPAASAVMERLGSGLARVADGAARALRGESVTEVVDPAVMDLLRFLYDSYFRVECSGRENLPAEGPALVVGNHSAGMFPWDATMAVIAVNRDHPEGRCLHNLAADLMFRVPLLGDWTRRMLGAEASSANLRGLLEAGEIAGLYPEGFRGSGKTFEHRYRLRHFGNGGFARAALGAGAPIVPMAIVGAEEACPILADLAPVAELVGLPYFPVTPTFPWLGPLGAVPLPTKWSIVFGEPVAVDGPATPQRVRELAEHVRGTLQAMLDASLARRTSVF